MRKFIFTIIYALCLLTMVSLIPSGIIAKEEVWVKPQNRSDKNKLPSYLNPLLQASQVSNRFQGRGGESKDFKLFERSLKDKSILLPALKKAMDSATPAGKIYISMIMMKHYPKPAKLNLKALAKDKTEFVFKEGCLVHSYTIDKAANELLTNGSLMSVDPTKI